MLIIAQSEILSTPLIKKMRGVDHTNYSRNLYA